MVLRLHPNQARDRLRWQDHEPRGLDVIEAMDHHLPGIIPGKAHRQGSASGDGLHVNFHAPVLGDNNWQHVFPIQLGAGQCHAVNDRPNPAIHHTIDGPPEPPLTRPGSTVRRMIHGFICTATSPDGSREIIIGYFYYSPFPGYSMAFHR